MSELLFLLMMLVPSVPFLIIYSVGGILCLVRRRRQPRLARLGLVAFTLFFVRVLVGEVLRSWLLLRRPEFGWDHTTLSAYLGIVNGCGILVAIVAWVFLLIALFGQHNYLGPIVSQPYTENLETIGDTAIQER